MIRFDIKFNQNDYGRWMSASKRLEAKGIAEMQDLPRRCSIEFVNLIRSNIISQKNMGSYAPLNRRYEDWKNKYGSYQGWWQLMGDLAKVLQHRKIGATVHETTYFAGIPAGIKDSGGKSWFGEGDRGQPKYIAMYAFVHEYGGSYGKGGTHPERPLFRPTTKEYSEDRLPKQGDLTLKALAHIWR